MLSDPSLCDGDLVEFGLAIRLHRARLLALVAEAKVDGVVCPWRMADPYAEDFEDIGGDEDALQILMEA